GRCATLADLLAQVQQQPVVRCTGFEVVHCRDREPPLDWARPLLAQRSFWAPTLKYAKPALASVPLRWCLGFHEAEGAQALAPDPRLVLVPLHRLDYDSCRARHLSRLQRTWSARDLAQGNGLQNRLVAEQEFETWFCRPEQISPFMEP